MSAFKDNAAEQRFEHPAIGIKTGGEQDRILHPDIGCDFRLQFAVQIIGAADEPHGGHAKPVRIQRRLRRFDQLWMIGKAEIIVGAKVEQAAPVSGADMRTLRCQDRALYFPQRCFADGGQFFGKAGQAFSGQCFGLRHDVSVQTF